MNGNPKTFVQKSIWFVFILLLWEGVGRFGGVSPLLFPPLSRVLAILFMDIQTGELLIQLTQSLGLILIGIMVGLFLALHMAFLDYFYPWLSSLFSLLASILHPLPGVALLPVVILWAGVGLQAVFVIVIHAVLWSLFLTIRHGFLSIERDLIEVAKNHGATHSQLFYYVLIPCSQSAISTGLQIAWSRGWRALISAEMIFGAMSSLGGMGWYMYEKRAFMDTEGLFGGLLVIILVGVLVEQLLFSQQERI